MTPNVRWREDVTSLTVHPPKYTEMPERKVAKRLRLKSKESAPFNYYYRSTNLIGEWGFVDNTLLREYKPQGSVFV